MVEICKQIANAEWFSRFITSVILLGGLLVGVETYPWAVAHFGGPLDLLDKIILGIFTLEIAIKMTAEHPKPWRYFFDPWNVFDFLIVSLAYLPVDADFVTVLRLARVLRVLKLVRALPKLQILVSALLKSIPSMAYVSLLLFLLFYLFGVTAVFLFGANDPIHFENLQISMLSLFRVVTLEGWTELMYIQMYGCDQSGYDGIEQMCTQPEAYPIFGALFFVMFVLLGTMIVLNLFVGVIMNGMEEAAKEQTIERELEDRPGTLQSDVSELLGQIEDMRERLEKMQSQLKLRS